MSVRHRCNACGNVTRFDVVATRRTKAFFHYSVGGELTVEEEELLDERVERVTCRWCGAEGDSVETLLDDEVLAATAALPTGGAGAGARDGDPENMATAALPTGGAGAGARDGDPESKSAPVERA